MLKIKTEIRSIYISIECWSYAIVTTAQNENYISNQRVYLFIFFFTFCLVIQYRVFGLHISSMLFATHNYLFTMMMTKTKSSLLE